MAVPSVSSVSPSTVWSHGQFVTVTGTNFRVAPIPSYALAGPYPAPIPAVAVTVGGVAATSVQVRSATELTCIVPAADPGSAVAIAVQNLDDAGVAIAGESASLAGALTYKRPDLAVEPDLSRLTRQVLRDIKRSVIENVVSFLHTDFEGDGNLELADVAVLPAIGLSGPHITWQSPIYQRMEDVFTGGDPATTFQQRHRSLTCDLGYEMTLLAKGTGQLVALQAATLLWLHRHTHVEIDRDPADLAKGKARYYLHVQQGALFRTLTVPNPSNVRAATAAFTVRGVHLEEMAGFAGEGQKDKGGTLESLTVTLTRI